MTAGKIFADVLEETLSAPDVPKVRDLLDQLSRQAAPSPETVKALLVALSAPDEAVRSVGLRPALDEAQIKAAFGSPRPDDEAGVAGMVQGKRIDCTVMLATIVADCIGVVLAAMGVLPMVTRRVGIALAGYREIDRVATSAMRMLLKELSEARQLKQSARVAELVLKIAQTGINTLGTKVILRALAAEMKWYDWAATGVWLAGEIAAFVASGGLALAGQVAIIVGTAAFLAIDIDKYGKGCC